MRGSTTEHLVYGGVFHRNNIVLSLLQKLWYTTNVPDLGGTCGWIRCRLYSTFNSYFELNMTRATTNLVLVVRYRGKTVVWLLYVLHTPLCLTAYRNVGKLAGTTQPRLGGSA